MKKIQRGSVNIWLVIIIVLLVIAVGYFAFIKKPTSIDQQATSTPEAQTTSQPIAPASITVTSPNGGEVWKMSEQESVKWTSIGLSDNAQVAIRLRSVSDFFDFCDPVNGEVSAKQGFFVITPATTMCVGKTSSLPEDRFKLSVGNYKVEIGVENYGGIGMVDTSDNYFTIKK